MSRMNITTRLRQERQRQRRRAAIAKTIRELALCVLMIAAAIPVGLTLGIALAP